MSASQHEPLLDELQEMVCCPMKFEDTYWRTLDVMRKGKSFKRNEWSVLQIRIRGGSCEERFIDLGKHKNREQACDYAERLMVSCLH